jgi:hypothetical protein
MHERIKFGKNSNRKYHHPAAGWRSGIDGKVIRGFEEPSSLPGRIILDMPKDLQRANILQCVVP